MCPFREKHLLDKAQTRWFFGFLVQLSQKNGFSCSHCFWQPDFTSAHCRPQHPHLSPAAVAQPHHVVSSPKHSSQLASQPPFQPQCLALSLRVIFSAVPASLCLQKGLHMHHGAGFLCLHNVCSLSPSSGLPFPSQFSLDMESSHQVIHTWLGDQNQYVLVTLHRMEDNFLQSCIMIWYWKTYIKKQGHRLFSDGFSIHMLSSQDRIYQNNCGCSTIIWSSNYVGAVS